jgi:hypothetical protein
MVKKTAPVGFRMRQRSFMIEHRPGIAHVEKAAAHSHRKKCSASSRLHADALADDDAARNCRRDPPDLGHACASYS